jgi:hypothetical protein
MSAHSYRCPTQHERRVSREAMGTLAGHAFPQEWAWKPFGLGSWWASNMRTPATWWTRTPSPVRNEPAPGTWHDVDPKFFSWWSLRPVGTRILARTWRPSLDNIMAVLLRLGPGVPSPRVPTISIHACSNIKKWRKSKTVKPHRLVVHAWTHPI